MVDMGQDRVLVLAGPMLVIGMGMPVIAVVRGAVSMSAMFLVMTMIVRVLVC